MRKYTYLAVAVILTLSAVPAHAATLTAQLEGWGFDRIDAGTFRAYALGKDTKALLVKIPATPEAKTPSIRIMDVQGDASKLNSDVQTWRSVILVNMASKPMIINERILTIGGQQRYFVEFQTNTGTETMLQTSVMAFVMNGKIYKLLYENSQAVYRLDIADVRKAFESVKLTVE